MHYNVLLSSKNTIILLQVLTQKLADKLIGSQGGVMQVQAVSSARRKVGCVGAGIGIQHLDGRSGEVGRVIAVAKAIRQVCITIHNSDGTSVVCSRSGEAGQGEELAKGDGALCRVGEGQDGGVEVGAAEKGVLVADCRGSDEVCVVETREAVGLVDGCDFQVDGGHEDGHGRAVCGEARQDGGVEGGRVHGGHGLGDCAAEAVAHADDGVEARVAEGAVAQREGELVGDAGFQGSLDRLDRVGFG